jgi:hypothetical protein
VTIRPPAGYNPASGTEDPRREDYDLYAGPQGQETFFEAKMDWQSGITGRVFVEEKTLRNTKADKVIIGRLLLDVFEPLAKTALSVLYKLSSPRACPCFPPGRRRSPFYKHLVQSMCLSWRRFWKRDFI